MYEFYELNNLWTGFKENTEWAIIHSGILVDYKNKMSEDTTMKLMSFEIAYFKVLLCI